MTIPQLRCPVCDTDELVMAQMSSDGVQIHKCGECLLMYIDAVNVARAMAKHGLPGPDAPGSADDTVPWTNSCAHCESTAITKMRGPAGDESPTYDLCEDCKGIHFESEWQDDFAGVNDVRALGELLKACAGK